ncbi:MAG: DUF4129 domain-containing protein [Gemmatimonadales bacterium]
MIPAAPADSLRALLDSVFAGPAYRWIERPRPLAPLERWWSWLQTWLQGLRETSPQLFYWFTWTILALLLLVFLHAGWVLWRTVRAASAPSERGPGVGTVPARDAAWYRREADRLAEAGRHLEALQHAFRALVLDLDRRGLLRFHPSKTPGEYTRDPALPPAERERLRALVQALYGYAFARRPCGQVEYQSWRGLAGNGWHAAAH